MYNMDCMEYMKSCKDNEFDLAIVDPPYGIGMGAGHKGSDKRGDKNKHKNFAGGDSEIPTLDYFKELMRVSNNQIIWGANYMMHMLPSTPCYIVWDKKQPEAFSMAMCEFAWTSFKSPAKIYTQRVVGADIERIHPTQKPVKLYQWLLDKYAKPTDRILDTHLGSASSAIAAHYFGCEFVGLELDKWYFDESQKRFKDATAQTDMFGMN